MIYLIYTNQQKTEAEEILYFLTEEKKLTVISNNKNCCIVQSNNRIAQDSAIILVSNAAVEDKEWQTLVAGLSEEVRIIPVNSTRNEDYADPEHIPPKIREINYIRMDGKHLENIWDSLNTEKEFYMIKNMLLLNKSVWIFSGHSEDFLLTDSKKIKQYLLLFQEKMRQEKNSYFYQELHGITRYLNASMEYARKLLKKKIKNYVKHAINVIAIIACVFLLRTLFNHVKRLTYTNAVISAGAYGEAAPINSIKLVDGITNPYLTDQKRNELYQSLSEHLNKNWYNAAVGVNYLWRINDAQIASDERYIWSANWNGNVVKWDTYTGEIVEQMNVSEQPLLAIAVSEHEKIFVVIDFDGYILKKANDGPWEKSTCAYEIPLNVGTDIVCNEEENWAVVTDINGTLRWFDLQFGIDIIWEAQFDEIFCMELSSTGLEAVVSKNDELYDLCIYADGAVDETGIPIDMDSACSMDIRNGVLVMADSKFQIVTWSRTDPETICPTGLVLSRPLNLCFLNDQVIVYYDRNAGTHLYDLKRKLDLGSILKQAVLITSLSTSKNTVMAFSVEESECRSENIEALLPLDEINRNDVCAVYAEKEMSSDGIIRQASVENEYIIRVGLRLAERDMTVMIDGANRYYIGAAQRDPSLVQVNGTDVFYYVDSPVSFAGKPTVIGIVHDGEVLLIGSSDGSFFELTFSETGDCLRGAQFQIPSHSSIVAICQTADRYYIEDTTGTFWSIRIGYDSLTPEGAVAAVKEKLHCAAAEDIRESVSKETLKALDVAIMPGGGVKVWE